MFFVVVVCRDVLMFICNVLLLVFLEGCLSFLELGFWVVICGCDWCCWVVGWIIVVIFCKIVCGGILGVCN